MAAEVNRAILEIRPGTGGQEAELFAGQLLRMYRKFAERRNWRLEIVEYDATALDGLKKAVARVSGEGCFATLRTEGGVHRVQRIPTTEKKGRVHTSTVTVAVLPVLTQKTITIKPADLKVDTFRASGHGGQNVNKVETAVRIIHLPSGITVTSQNERSQAQNREIALQILQAKLEQAQEAERRGELGVARADQIGTAERAEKIRTYNFPQDRITDHRVGKSFSRIDRLLNGELDPIVRALR